MEKAEFENWSAQAVKKALSLLQYKNIDIRLLDSYAIQEYVRNGGGWRYKFSVEIGISQKVEHLSFPDTVMTDPEYPVHLPLIQPDTINKLEELKSKVPDLEWRAACLAAWLYALGIRWEWFVPAD